MNVTDVKRVLPLVSAFAIGRGHAVSLAGGGGKTSLMYLLARALTDRGWRVVTTTTTRIYPPTESESPSLVLLDEVPDGLAAVRQRLAKAAHVTVAARRNPDGKLAGISPAAVDRLAAAGLADVIVVEADGSAGRPLKAAGHGEPVYPASTTHCLLVIGADALGVPLDEATVFRSVLAAEISGLALGAPVTAETVAALLLGPRGLAAPAPSASRLAVFVNKVEDPGREAVASHLALRLLKAGAPRLERVVVGSLWRADAGFRVFER